MPLFPLVHDRQNEAVLRLVEASRGSVGLEWDRYLPLWDEQRLRVKEVFSPLNHFATRVNDGDRPRLQEPWMRECRERLRRATEAIARQRGLVPVSWEGTLTWRMAAGLGAEHPTENGFSFEHTTGLPVISATSVKGLCRAAAWIYGWEREDIERLFGPEEITAEFAGERGEAFFCDAWPISWPHLEVDIANSHHPQYYGRSEKTSDGDKGNRDPVETEDPNPVNFLTIAPGAVFRFSLLAPEKDKIRLEKLLPQALDDLGIGAKTAVGYGRFRARGKDGAGDSSAPAINPRQDLP